MDIKQQNNSVRFLKLFFIGLSLIVVACLAIFAGLMGIAYDKITIKDQNLTQKIRHGVMNINGMPKTKMYILEKSVQMNKTMKTVNLDASLAISSPNLEKLFDSKNLDIIVRGNVDVSKPEPEKMDVNVQVSKMANLDLRVLNKDTYVKFNTLPRELIKSIIPLTEAQISRLENKWIKTEDDTLDSEARRAAQKMNKETPAEKAANERATNYAVKKVLPKSTMSEELVNGKKMYKVEIPFSNQDIREIQRIVESAKTVSDVDEQMITQSTQQYTLEDVSMTVWVDKKDYFAKRMSFSTQIVEQPNQAYHTALPFDKVLNKKTLMVGVINMSDINKPFTVAKPEKVYTSDELADELMK